MPILTAIVFGIVGAAFGRPHNATKTGAVIGMIIGFMIGIPFM